jgi:hypothetical protein
VLPASWTVSTGSFSGVKWPGHGVHHPPTSSSEVAKGLELFLHLPSVPALACHWVTIPLLVPFTIYC